MRILMINKVTKVNIFKTQLLENIFVANQIRTAALLVSRRANMVNK